MKTILVLTDFSANAAHAAKSAVMLSGALNANLLLYNTKLILPVSTYYADYAGGPWVVDDFVQWENESKEKMEQLAEDLQPLIARLDPKLRKPAVHYKSGDGSLGQNVAELTQKNNIELIVMGASSQSTFEHILNGSDTHSIIEHATCPILVIPQGSDLKKLKRVIFATDFDEVDMNAINYLAGLGKLFNYQLEIVHVSLTGKNDGPKNEHEATFLKQLKRLDYPYITYKLVHGRDVVEGLNNFCKEDEADLLAIVHYQNSYITRILRHSTTKKALSNQNMLLLVLPSKMEKD